MRGLGWAAVVEEVCCCVLKLIAGYVFLVH